MVYGTHEKGKIVENIYIAKFNTHHSSLNRDLGFMSPYVNNSVLHRRVYNFLYALMMTSSNEGVTVV